MELEHVLQEYKIAVQENIEASKAETDARIKKQKAHNRLLKASEALRSTTRDLLEDTLVLN